MGGSTSTEYGNIYVALSKDHYFPGENVVGTVYVQIKESFPGNTLLLKVKGKEIVESDKFEDETNILEHMSSIYVWNGDLVPPGQYELPFAFVLPLFLPGTCELEDKDNRSKAKIEYKLKAYLDPLTNKKEKRLQYKRPILIRELIRGHSMSIRNQINSEIKHCGCVNAGSCLVNFYFQRNTYAIGERAVMVCNIDNSRGSKDLREIKCELICRVQIRDKTYSKTKTVEYPISSATVQGVAAGQTFMNEHKRQAELDLIASDGRQLLPTCNGNLVVCEYVVKVTTNYDVACPSSDMVTNTEAPITVFLPWLNQDPVPAAPIDWQPYNFPVANIVLTNTTSDNRVAPPLYSENYA
jgi:sporulation-control protein spo0M